MYVSDKSNRESKIVRDNLFWSKREERHKLTFKRSARKPRCRYSRASIRHTSEED